MAQTRSGLEEPGEGAGRVQSLGRAPSELMPHRDLDFILKCSTDVKLKGSNRERNEESCFMRKTATFLSEVWTTPGRFFTARKLHCGTVKITQNPKYCDYFSHTSLCAFSIFPSVCKPGYYFSSRRRDFNAVKIKTRLQSDQHT